MALQKSIALPAGVSGDYFRMVAFIWERESRHASAHFALFKDAATATSLGSQPLVPIAAKLRLSGEDFDEYLGPAALAAAANDVIGQLYTAARAISLERHTSGETRVEAHIASDFGHDLFWDAVDV